MTGRWRLLAIFLLIFVALLVAPASLTGQDVAGDRLPNVTPPVVPVLPNLLPLPYPSPIAPVGIPPPSLPRPNPIAPGATGFRSLVRAAGIIFSGRVTFIGRATSSSGPNPVSTTVTFQVEHAMRGVSLGQMLTIHEWGGLWTKGERYYVGESVLLFLYSPGRLGLTSPVAGTLGRFAIDSQGRIVMSAQHIATWAADPILGGRTVVSYPDFTLAVRRSSGEE
jgi:hypothetical protein